MVTCAGQRPRPGAVSRCPARSGRRPGKAASPLASLLAGQRAPRRQAPCCAFLRPSHATGNGLRNAERRAAELSSPVFSTNACGDSAGKRKCSPCAHSSTQPVAADRRKRRNGPPDRFSESAARDNAADDPPGPRPACLRSLRLPGREHRELCRSPLHQALPMPRRQGRHTLPSPRLLDTSTDMAPRYSPAQPRNRVPAPTWPCTKFAAARQKIVFIGPEVNTLFMACES